MNFKNQFQLELREALRSQDRPRIDCLRLVLAACEQVQETIGKQTYEAAPQGAAQLPDRQQVLTRQAIADILQTEINQHLEVASQLHAGGFVHRAMVEETRIDVFQHYLNRVQSGEGFPPRPETD